jgi:hypothetical protein
MDSFDNFFSKLTLINYPPGYLGSFIINLLACETEGYKNLSNATVWTGLQSNQEWAILDYFVGGDTIKHHEDILDKLKLEFPDPDKALLYLIALLTHKRIVKNNYLPGYFSNVFNDLYTVDLKELANTEIDNILFPYTKSHPDQSSKNVVNRSMFGSTLPWKNKIYCVFPDDKKWIPVILLLHKRNFSLKEPINDLLDFSYNYSNSLPDHKTINAYDIVFKQDLTSLYNVYPNFELTKKRKEILAIATKTNNDILNRFDLTHTISYNTSIIAKESINAIYFNKK